MAQLPHVVRQVTVTVISPAACLAAPGSRTVQVEHTVTEEITGVDIVQTQVKIAGGASLADLGLGSQALVPPAKGYAIQCRVTSEDPEQNFQVRSGLLCTSPGLCIHNQLPHICTCIACIYKMLNICCSTRTNKGRLWNMWLPRESTSNLRG
jgi:hypothetical protein